jgi:carbonic anhydrase
MMEKTPRLGGQMSLIDNAVSANATIANDYVSRAAPPQPKVVIVTCADPRMTGIGEMMGLADSDVDLIRNLGSVIDEDSIRGILVSTRLLGSKEVMIINHTGCGMTTFTDAEFAETLRKETGHAVIAPDRFFAFTDTDENTREQIQKARSHPWISANVPVRGFVFDLESGRLHEVFTNDSVAPAS